MPSEQPKSSADLFGESFMKRLKDGADRDDAVHKQAPADPCADAGPIWYRNCREMNEYVKTQPTGDLIPMPHDPPYLAFGSIIISLIVIGLVVGRWPAIRAQIDRWLLRPITRKTTRGADSLKRWWLED